jgi:hypothetical protein
MVGMTKFFLGNWATRAYFLAVVAAATFLVVANAAIGPSFAGIFLIALTSPVSVIFAPIFLLGQGWMTVPMMIASVTAGYLLNTLLINTIVGEVGKLRHHRA